MKYLQTLGILSAACAALMAFAGGAWATTLTGPSGETTPTIHAVNENGHVSLQNAIARIECSSTIEGTVTSHGTGATASGPASAFGFSSCTNGWHKTTVTGGLFELHYLSPGVGTLTSSGATIASTRLGVTCNFETNNTDVGKITDSSVTNGVATVHIELSLPIEAESSSGLCGSGNVKVEGSYISTQKLFIDP